MPAYGTAYAKDSKPEFRTQKANSVVALARNGFDTPDFKIYPVESFVGNFATHSPSELVGRFVRPCPVRPRHGFVDSRPINSVDDAIGIINETYEIEPDAELISMPFVNCDYSAIWTDGQLVIGPSNDGATSGHGSVVIPVIGTPNAYAPNWNNAKKEAGITESPYVEMLWSKDSWSQSFKQLFVQLRNGPALPKTIDYIPASMTVQNVVIADGDLLEWETKAKNFPAGTVVYHPNGSLASHYAVHAVLNGIPVMISREPKIGETIEPNTEAAQPSIGKIRAGFVLALKADMTYQQAGLVMLAGCHSTSAWLGKADTLLGMALGCAFRLTVTACLGEYRHHPKNSRRGRKPKQTKRDEVYTYAWDKVFTQMIRTRFKKAMDSFANDNWPSSFGGSAWYHFGKHAGNIYDAVCAGNVTEALEHLNKCVHAAHNSGWGFNKFMSQSFMNEAAKNPCTIVFKIAPYLYDAISGSEKDKSLELAFKGKNRYKFAEIEDDGRDVDSDSDVDDSSPIEDASEPEYCSLCRSNECKAGHPNCSNCHEVNHIIKPPATPKPKPHITKAQGKLLAGKKTLKIVYELSDGNIHYVYVSLSEKQVAKAKQIFDMSSNFVPNMIIDTGLDYMEMVVMSAYPDKKIYLLPDGNIDKAGSSDWMLVKFPEDGSPYMENYNV